MSSKSKKNRSKVSDLILKNRKDQVIAEEPEREEDDLEMEEVEDDEGTIVLTEDADEPEEVEDIDETEDDESDDEEEETSALVASPVAETTEETTIGSIFLNRVFKFDTQLAHRLVADMMMTDLVDVSNYLREWYVQQSPSVFANYDIAKENVFQFLIKEFEPFDADHGFAHAVAHWFVYMIGLRKQR